MIARSIGSIIWTSFTGVTKLLAKLYLSLRKTRGMVKKSARTFYSSMLEEGIPKEVALNITSSYASPGLELLKIRNIIRMVSELRHE